MVESDRQDANKLLFDRVCLHCISYLETFNECEGVEFFSPRKAGPADFASWEKKNLPYKLPADLTSFYEMFDGFRLDFKTEVGSSVLTVGTMLLNSISDMERIPLEGNFPGMSDLSTMSSAGFALENKSEIGNIVLLYRSQEDKEKMLGSFNSATVLMDSPLLEHSPSSLGITADTAGEKQKDKDKLFESPEVWFQDVSSRWHFLSPTFSNFMRIMVVHLGVHGWQLAFTPDGLPPSAKAWMNLFCKERLTVDVHEMHMTNFLKHNKNNSHNKDRERERERERGQ